MSDFNLIGQIKIDAGNSNDVIKNLNGNIQVLATKLNDVEVKSGGANNSLKNFFKEQRLQDRTMREGIQSITSLALVFNTLGGNSSEASKKLGESLSMAAGVMNSMEFAGFGLSQMGKGLGGTLGTLISRIGGLAGPIGMVVGVGVGLLEFFDDSKEKAEKARIEQEKLKKSLNELKEAVSNFNKLALENLTEKGMQQAKAQWQGWAESGKKSIDETEKNLKGMRKELSQVELEAKTPFKIVGTKSVLKTEEEKQADIDKVNSLKSQIKLNEDLLVSIKEGYEWNKLQVEETDKAIESLKLKGKAEKTTGGFEHKPKEKPKSAEQIAKDEYDKKMDAYQLEIKSWQLALKMAEFKKDEIGKIAARNNLEAIYQKMLADTSLTAEDILEVKEQQLDAQKEVQQATDKATQDKIEKEKQFADFKKDLITDEIEKINEAEKDKIKILEKAFEDELVSKEDKEKLLTAIEKEAKEQRTAIAKTEADKQAQIEKTIRDVKIKMMNDSFSVLLGITKEGSDLHKGIAIAQIAAQFGVGVMDAYKIASEGAIGTGPLAPYMWPIFFTSQMAALVAAVGQAKSVGGFATGGFTGEGGMFEPAGLVHKGEVVFEKPLVDKYKNPLLQLRTMMQNGGSYVPYNTNGYDMGTQRELKALRSDMNLFMKQDRNVNVSLKGTLKGQKFLKDEMPKHNKFTKNKYV